MTKINQCVCYYVVNALALSLFISTDVNTLHYTLANVNGRSWKYLYSDKIQTIKCKKNKLILISHPNCPATIIRIATPNNLVIPL